MIEKLSFLLNQKSNSIGSKFILAKVLKNYICFFLQVYINVLKQDELLDKSLIINEGSTKLDDLISIKLKEIRRLQKRLIEKLDYKKYLYKNEERNKNSIARVIINIQHLKENIKRHKNDISEIDRLKQLVLFS